MVFHLRVDERLAHGQVCAIWVKFLGATHLLIANDAVANDPFQKQMMSIGIPNTVKHLFCTIDKAIEIMNDPKAAPLKILPVVKCPADAVKILNNVKGIDQVIFGTFGMITPLDKATARRPCPEIMMDDENFALLKEIREKTKKEVFYHHIPDAKPVKMDF
jgi:PTS system mannose-specific IIB component